jgi:hypothetical protein
MAPPFDLMDWDDEDDLSTMISRTTQIDSETASNTSGNIPKLPVRLIDGRRYLEVDQSANRRAGLKISLIWQHGLELRLMDSPDFDKYWLCSLYPSQTTIIKIIKDINSNTSVRLYKLYLAYILI